MKNALENIHLEDQDYDGQIAYNSVTEGRNLLIGSGWNWLRTVSNDLTYYQY